MSDLRVSEAFPLPPDKSVEKKPVGGDGFGALLDEAVGKISRLDREANRSVAELLQGKADLPEVMMTSQKLDLSMRLFLTVRNKVIEAYKEIMHMQF